MTEALNEFQAKTSQAWSLNPGDGAFYGPKIDVQVRATRGPHTWTGPDAWAGPDTWAGA